MKRKNKTGISMIVLVITIIIMIILAASVVITLNNTGIIRQSNVAVDKSELKEVEHAVALAWAEAYMEGNRTPEALREAMETKLEGTDLSNYEYEPTDKGVTVTQVVKRAEETQIPKLNEYGFYYDVSYTLPLSVLGIGPIRMVLHEDGSGEVYSGLSAVTMGIQTCIYSYGPGSFVYGSEEIQSGDKMSGILYGSEKLYISKDGSKLTPEETSAGSQDLEFVCDYKKPGVIDSKKVYKGINLSGSMGTAEVSFPDSEHMKAITYIISEDGTELVPTETIYDIYLEGNGHMVKFKDKTYSDKVNVGAGSMTSTMEEAYGYFSFDGEQLLLTSIGENAENVSYPIGIFTLDVGTVID